MHLKKDFITHEMFDQQIMVGVGNSGFSGMVRSNATAAFIVDCLKKPITRDVLIDTMHQRYDAPREVLAKDVDDILTKLRSIGALDE